MPTPNTKCVFLTGATGFLGSHLCWALLEQGSRVVVLARKTPAHSARQRVLDVLERVSDQDSLGAAEGRIQVLEGDVALPKLGLPTSEWERAASSVDEIWHSAASLSFLEDDRPEIFRMNVDGTRNILDLASALPTRRLHHVSTAYVAGNRSGLVREDEVDVGQTFRNPYEESKCIAESLVRSAHDEERVSATLYRPSIVIGDSVTGRATHFHGVYAFIRGLWTVARRLRRGQPHTDLIDMSLRIQGSRSSTLNFVPIDYVTAAIMTLAGAGSSPGRTFHLTNPEATPNQLWLAIVCRQLAVRGVSFVDRTSFDIQPMTQLEALFHRQMTFYSPYLSSEPRFDCRETLAALATKSVRCPIVDEVFTARMTGWYIDLLNGRQSQERLQS